MWGAVVPMCAVFMFIMFYMYISPEACTGYRDCSHYTLPNGTVRMVPAGQQAAVSKDPRQPMLLAFPLLVMSFVYASLWTFRRLKRETSTQ